MSSFHCHHCGAACLQFEGRYQTGCEHYPADGADYRPCRVCGVPQSRGVYCSPGCKHAWDSGPGSSARRRAKRAPRGANKIERSILSGRWGNERT